MAMKHGIYTQVIMLRRKYKNFFATDNIKNEAKFMF